MHISAGSLKARPSTRRAETRLAAAMRRDRGGASCDFIVDDEDMRQVADWIIANVPFDRLYFCQTSERFVDEVTRIVDPLS